MTRIRKQRGPTPAWGPLIGAAAAAFIASAPAALAQDATRGQDDRTVIDQIAPLAPADKAVAPVGGAADRDVDPGDQLSGGAAAKQPVAQLSREKKTADPGRQLYRGKRTAKASTPLSTPEEGRKQEVVRLKGSDRCDTAKQGARHDPDCANVIENRSAEYARPSPTALSPEQRLLIYQRAREEAATGSGSAGHVRQALDPDDLEAQGVASLVLPRDQTEKPADKPAEEPSMADQAVLDIVQAITQQQASPQQ